MRTHWLNRPGALAVRTCMVEGNIVEVDSDQMREVAHILEAPRQRLYSITNEYTAKTASLFGVWGEDRFGAEYGRVYVPTHDTVIDTNFAIVEGIAETQNDLRLTAESWEKIDHTNAT